LRRAGDRPRPRPVAAARLMDGFVDGVLDQRGTTATSQPAS
jgi:hypothetical protein